MAGNASNSRECQQQQGTLPTARAPPTKQMLATSETPATAGSASNSEEESDSKDAKRAWLLALAGNSSDASEGYSRTASNKHRDASNN